MLLGDKKNLPTSTLSGQFPTVLRNHRSIIKAFQNNCVVLLHHIFHRMFLFFKFSPKLFKSIFQKSLKSVQTLMHTFTHLQIHKLLKITSRGPTKMNSLISFRDVLSFWVQRDLEIKDIRAYRNNRKLKIWEKLFSYGKICGGILYFFRHFFFWRKMELV